MSLPKAPLIFLFISHFVAGMALPAELDSDHETTIVDEVVAVVGTAPILASDIDLAALVGITSRDPEESEEEYWTRLLDARIRLELQYRNLESTGALYRLDLEATGVVEDLVARLSSDAGLSSRLELLGLGRTDIEDLGLRLAATTAYVEQRLRQRITLTSTELEEAYQRLIESLPPTEAPPPLPSVEIRLRQLLVERKLNGEIERWLEEAKARQEVIRFRH